MSTEDIAKEIERAESPEWRGLSWANVSRADFILNDAQGWATRVAYSARLELERLEKHHGSFLVMWSQVAPEDDEDAESRISLSTEFRALTNEASAFLDLAEEVIASEETSLRDFCARKGLEYLYFDPTDTDSL